MSWSTQPLLLDTSVLVHLIRRDATGTAMDEAYGLSARSERPLISVVSIGELYSLARQWNWGPSKIARLRALVRELVVVDIRNETVLQRYAEIDRYLAKIGRRIGDNDTWIAATAAAADAILLTNDEGFDPLNASTLLKVIYFDPQVSRT